MTDTELKDYEKEKFAERFGYHFDIKNGMLDVSMSSDVMFIVTPYFKDIDVPEGLLHLILAAPRSGIILFGEESRSFADHHLCDVKVETSYSINNVIRPDKFYSSSVSPCTSQGIDDYLKQVENHMQRVNERLAKLPDKLREFLEKGIAAGLDYDVETGCLGDEFRFCQYAPNLPISMGKEEPRPEGLPWIIFNRKFAGDSESNSISSRFVDSGVLVLVRPEEVDFKKPASKFTDDQLKAIGIVDCNWPDKEIVVTDYLLNEYLDIREYERGLLPNFFIADTYDADVEEPMLIDGLVPETGITLVVGDWHVGKTTLLVDWAAHIAYGLPWLGRDTKLRPVIYYAMETGQEIGKRITATRCALNDGEGSRTGLGAPPVVMLNNIPDDLNDWKKEIRTNADESKRRVWVRCEDQGLSIESLYTHHPLPLIVIDTLSQATGHKRLGSNVEELFDKIDQLVKDEVVAHVIIAHHTTKTGDVFAGDDFLGADTTALYYVRRKNPDVQKFHLECERVKGMKRPQTIPISFRAVEIGKQTTVVVEGEATVDERLLSIARSLPERMSLDELREELDPHITGESTDARRKSFQRRRKELIDAGLIDQDGNEFVLAA